MRDCFARGQERGDRGKYLLTMIPPLFFVMGGELSELPAVKARSTEASIAKRRDRRRFIERPGKHHQVELLYDGLDKTPGLVRLYGLN